MSGLFNNVGAVFQVIGEVTGKRHWKSDKSDREGWYLNVACKGVTFEVEVPKAEQENAAVGTGYRFTGNLGVSFGKVTLVAEKMEVVTGAVPMSRAAS